MNRIAYPHAQFTYGNHAALTFMLMPLTEPYWQNIAQELPNAMALESCMITGMEIFCGFAGLQWIAFINLELAINHVAG